jgi:hypothetical protein
MLRATKSSSIPPSSTSPFSYTFLCEARFNVMSKGDDDWDVKEILLTSFGGSTTVPLSLLHFYWAYQEWITARCKVSHTA